MRLWRQFAHQRQNCQNWDYCAETSDPRQKFLLPDTSAPWVRTSGEWIAVPTRQSIEDLGRLIIESVPAAERSKFHAPVIEGFNNLCLNLNSIQEVLKSHYSSSAKLRLLLEKLNRQTSNGTTNRSQIRKRSSTERIWFLFPPRQQTTGAKLTNLLRMAA